jgi:hypothetical protein
MWGSVIGLGGVRSARSGQFRSVAFVGVSMILLLTPPAAAASYGEGQHCVVHLVPIAPKTDEGVISAVLEDGGCFPTLEEALEAGTGGQVALAAGTSPAELTQSVLDTGVTAATDVLLGTEYDNLNFGGISHSYFASSGCASTTWQVANVGATWNDRFESGKGFGTCDHNRKFEHADFGGAVVLCTPNCGTYGALRDEITSLRWAD